MLRPKYVTPDQIAMNLSDHLIKSYETSRGEKKRVLLQKLKEIESSESDYKLVRGLIELLERRCAFVVESPLDPKSARELVFREASKRKAVGSSERNQVIRDVSQRIGVDPGDLEISLWKDLEEEQILKDFLPLDPKSLLMSYNLSLAQTALFKSTKMEFTASSNWKNIFRDIKRLGLMYNVEKRSEEEGEKYVVSLDGPLSLFKMTDRYGTSFAKLLNQIAESDSWSFKAELLDRMRNRILYFEENSANVSSLFRANKFESRGNSAAENEGSPSRLYDSTVEEKFANKFNGRQTGWVLKREPEPLVAGRQVLIPDFSFEKEGLKAYLEIVGFWTKEYLERKIAKLSSLANDVDIMIAVDESLACSKFDRIDRNNMLLLFYSKEVPLGPILDHLSKLEEVVRKRQVEILRDEKFHFDAEIVSMKSLAEARHVSLQTVKETFALIELEGYKKIGDYLVSFSKISKLEKGLQGLGEEPTLSQAVKAIEMEGVENPQQVLTALGYTVEWEGLDYERSKVRSPLRIS